MSILDNTTTIEELIEIANGLPDQIDTSEAEAGLTTFLTENGVTVPEGTLLDGLVALLGDVETGGADVNGVNIDWRGFPIVTGTFTVASDTSSYHYVSIPEGQRLHYVTKDGSSGKWKPLFVLFPDESSLTSLAQGYIQNIGSFPNTAGYINSPNNTGAIFAYVDGTSVNATYVKGVYNVSFVQTGFNSSNEYQDITITQFVIPASSNQKLKAGIPYRWMMFANIYAETAEVV